MTIDKKNVVSATSTASSRSRSTWASRKGRSPSSPTTDRDSKGGRRPGLPPGQKVTAPSRRRVHEVHIGAIYEENQLGNYIIPKAVWDQHDATVRHRGDDR
jgi:hypothetical protein